MYITLPIQEWLKLVRAIACVSSRPLYALYLNHKRSNSPKTLFFKTAALIEYDKTLLFLDEVQNNTDTTHTGIVDVLEMNKQLREQNTTVDKACAQLEKQVIELQETVLGLEAQLQSKDSTFI
jgi:hypothetical protein